jgi:hypothetical protein
VPDQGDPNAPVVTLTATLLDEQGHALNTQNTCRVDVNNHLTVHLDAVISPGSGVVTLTAHTQGSYPIVFSAYYADDPNDDTTVHWHNIGWGKPVGGGTWVLDWDTRSVPDQGNTDWGTVNICAALY